MRIAISTETDAGLDAPVAGHFGGSPFFTLIDLEGEQVQAVSAVRNPYFPNHEPGQVPAFIHSQGANVLVTGGMGRRAASFLEQHGIQAVTGAAGTAGAALAGFQRGELTDATPCSESGGHGHGHGHEHGHGHGHGHGHEHGHEHEHGC